MRTDPVAIMVAPNGAYASKSDNPATPITPAEIAAAVIDCADAGAAMAHIHARDDKGGPTQSIERFREIVERIREKSDIVLQISLGTPGFTIDEALEPVALKPEMVSLPLGAFLEKDAHAQDRVRQMAERIRDQGVRPELSVYNEAMLSGAIGLIERGAVASPANFGLIFKNPETMQQGVTLLLQLAQSLPKGSRWWLAKGGPFALGLRSLAIELGGHVRVGFEDSVLDFDGSQKAPSNAHLVERIARLSAVLGRPVASPADVRGMLARKGPAQ